MAPTAQALRLALNPIVGVKTILFRVNAGMIPSTHWLNDPQEGGGRLLGEGVHFIDFVCGMLDSEPTTVSAQGSLDGQDFAITIGFADQSLSIITYTSQGSMNFPKERVEVFAGKGVAVLEDFRSLTFTGMRERSSKGSQDKGHRALLDNFGAAVRGEADLVITGQDGLRATRIAQAAMESIRTGQTILLHGWRV